MARKTRLLIAFALTVLAGPGFDEAADRRLSRATANAPSPGAMARLTAAYGRRTLAFEANEGQTDGRVSFLARASRHSIFVTDDDLVISSPPPDQSDAGPDVVRMRLRGATSNAETVGERELPGTVNYFIGNDQSKWRTNVRTFAQVRRKDVYSGIDVVYHGQGEQLEYDFVLSAAGHVGDIQLEFDGADLADVESNGDLVLQTTHGELRHKAPIVYQEIAGLRTPIAGRYVRKDEDTVGFEVGSYDASKPLIIDPVLSYSTYLGSSGVSLANDVAVDSQGYAYITGYAGYGFPALGGLPTGYAGGYEAYITKLSPDGSSVVFSTYLGGSGSDNGTGITVDANGYVYVCGITFSTNFPIANAFQPVTPTLPTVDRQADGFAAKLTPAGNDLVFSTYLGGLYQDQAWAIAADTSGNAYIVGDTVSTDFPTLNALQPVKPDSTPFQYNGFVVKLGSSGAGVYSTYWGGNSHDSVGDIVADGAGNAYVTGITNSSDFPTQAAYRGTIYSSGNGAFVSKLSANGATLLYSTYLGGNGYTQGTGIALGPSGNIFVTGVTQATDFPAVNAYQPTHHGGTYDLFVTRFSLSGTSLDFSTYLGGTDNDFSSPKIAVDSADRATIAGATRSSNFPLKNAIQSTTSAGGDVTAPVVTKFVAAGNDVVYSTYAGGPLSGYGGGAYGVDVDSQSNVYVVGWTDGGLVTTPDVLQPGNPGSRSGFVLKISEAAAPCIYESQPASATTVVGGGPNNFSIVANGSSCAWTAVSNAGWIILTGATSGSGIGIVNYTVAFNGGFARVGTISVAGQIFTVTQAGTPQPSCNYGISPTTASMSSGSGPGNVNVTASASGCVWTAASNASWITITAGSGGTGNGSVSYFVAPHSGATPRSGTLTIANSTFTVTQANPTATPPAITAQPSNQTVAKGQDATFVVAASGYPTPSYQWQVSTNTGTSWTNLTNIAPYSGTTTAALTVARTPPGLTGAQYRSVGANSAGSATSAAATLTVYARTASVNDVDGDGKADFTVWRPDTGTFYWLTSSSTYLYAAAGTKAWGAGTQRDVPMTDDIDGDGKADLIVWRPGDGTWYWLTSSSGYSYAAAGAKQWGLGSQGDVPLTGDIDGDGKADLIVWRPGTGTWYWLTSASGYSYAAAGSKEWGAGSQGDKPLIADIDGDGKADVIVWRPGDGLWYWLTSSSGYNYAAFGSKPWGLGSQGDVPIAGDIDGDGKGDLIVWRPGDGTWYWLPSASGYTYAAAGSKQWGAGSQGDEPLIGDIDGDGKADLTVWRPGDGTWYWLQSSRGYSYARSKQWGLGTQGDVPLMK